MIHRRQLLLSSLAAAAAAGAPAGLKIGHRQASMRQAGVAVFDLAKRIDGLSGVELQVHIKNETLWDPSTLVAYRRAAKDAGILIPSIAGIWTPGVSLLHAKSEEQVRKAIEVAEALGARVVLVAAFRDRCPRVDDEASYGPVVKMLQKTGPVAASAGVTLGLETSLSPADDAKLVDIVNHRAVKVFLDANNTEFYGHTGQSLTGVPLLGKSRICQVHCKNEARLLEEPGRVDWTATLKALQQIGYDSWYVFETSHTSPEQCIEATRANIAFLRRNTA